MPHLVGDQRYETAMDDYYRLMQGFLSANPSATDNDIREIDEIIESRMMHKYPNQNPSASKPPAAETLASRPSGAGTSLPQDLTLPTNAVGIF